MKKANVGKQGEKPSPSITRQPKYVVLTLSIHSSDIEEIPEMRSFELERKIVLTFAGAYSKQFSADFSLEP